MADETRPFRVTIETALEWTARTMPELFFDVLAGMPEEIQESTLETVRKVRAQQEPPSLPTVGE
jgi:hypothetical protein